MFTGIVSAVGRVAKATQNGGLSLVIRAPFKGVKRGESIAVNGACLTVERVANPGLAGCPLLFGALATFECTRETTVAGGDHIVFFGRIQRAAYREGEPLTFSAGKYGTHLLLE